MRTDAGGSHTAQWSGSRESFGYSATIAKRRIRRARIIAMTVDAGKSHTTQWRGSLVSVLGHCCVVGWFCELRDQV